MCVSSSLAGISFAANRHPLHPATTRHRRPDAALRCSSACAHEPSAAKSRVSAGLLTVELAALDVEHIQPADAIGNPCRHTMPRAEILISHCQVDLGEADGMVLPPAAGEHHATVDPAPSAPAAFFHMSSSPAVSGNGNSSKGIQGPAQGVSPDSVSADEPPSDAVKVSPAGVHGVQNVHCRLIACWW